MVSNNGLVRFAPIAVVFCGLLAGCQTNSNIKGGELALAAAKVDVEKSTSKPSSNWQARMEEVRARQKARLEERRQARQARLEKLKTKNKAGKRSVHASQGDRDNGFRFGKAFKLRGKKIKNHSDVKGQYGNLIAKYASEHGVPYKLARAVVQVESNFRPNATGSVGEIGLMQIKLSTARGMGYKGSKKGLYDPATNLYWGMKYLGKAHRLSGGTTCGTILKYNAGHGAKRMNKISSRYCGKVKRILA